MVLVLLACGPGADTPTAGPGEQGSKAAVKDVGEARDSFVWGDASQPARDWDADAEECRGRTAGDPSAAKQAHRLVKVAAFMKCMQEMGWALKDENR
jgi:hypothetical protein